MHVMKFTRRSILSFLGLAPLAAKAAPVFCPPEAPGLALLDQFISKPEIDWFMFPKELEMDRRALVGAGVRVISDDYPMVPRNSVARVADLRKNVNGMTDLLLDFGQPFGQSEVLTWGWYPNPPAVSIKDVVQVTDNWHQHLVINDLNRPISYELAHKKHHPHES
jgi:hypothetical protein